MGPGTRAVMFAAAVIAAGCGGGSEGPEPNKGAVGAPGSAQSNIANDPLQQALATRAAEATMPSLAASGKVSPAVRAQVSSGSPQNLIVVFDDTAAQAQANAARLQQGLPAFHPRILKQKSDAMSEIKSRTLGALHPNEVTQLRHYSHLPLVLARVRSKAALERLLADPNVVGVYEDHVLHRAMLAQSLPLIRQTQAAAIGDQGVGTAVAVLDQRVDYTLPAFGACTSPGVPAGCKVLVAQDVQGLPNDGLGFQDNHGTNVAATVLAVAPAAKVISLNVFQGENTTDSTVIDAINWCIANSSTYHIVAMNLSLGGGGSTVQTTNSAYYSAFANARAVGILPVVAAGNNGYTNGLSLPGAVAGAVSVGAVYDSAYGFKSWVAPCTDAITAADQVACFSNSASFLTLLAPGCEDDAGLATYMCGTSQATPHVAGAVAVLRSAFPTESLTQTVSRLTNGNQLTDAKNGISKPRLNLALALNLPTCSASVSQTALFPAASGTASSSLSVASASGCPWSASSGVSWITILSGATGTGNGTVQYYVAPNYGTSSRSGTLQVAGTTINVTQSGGAVSPSSSSSVWLVGTDTYKTVGNSVLLTVGQIFNASLYRTTGTLRTELWLANNPFVLGGRGWRVATWQLGGTTNGTLGPWQSFVGLASPYLPMTGLPPPGQYYAQLVLTEYYGATNTCAADHFCLDSFADFSGKFYIPDVTPPTVPGGLAAYVQSSSQITLAWAASSDDVGVVAYKVYSNGTLLGRVSSNGARVFNLSSARQYQFSVSACDAAENCSGQSSPVIATTLAAASPSDCLFSWAERAYPQYFPGSGAAGSLTAGVYYYRYYPSTGNYLAISSADGDVWVLGPVSGGAMLDVGPKANYMSVAGCPR